MLIFIEELFISILKTLDSYSGMIKKKQIFQDQI